IAYLTMFYTLGPMFAPIVGGALVDTLGWRSVFAFSVAAGSAITLAVYAAIPETRPQGAVAASDRGILRAPGALLRVPVFTACVLETGLNTGAFMSLASASSTLMKDVLHRPSTEYGLYFLLFPIGYFLGTVLSSRVGNRASNETMVLIGSLLAITTITTQAVLLLNGIVMPITIFVPGFFLTMSQGIALPYSQVGAMAVIPALAGTAAGIGVFMQNFWGAIFAQIYGLIADGTPRPMVLIMALCGVLCLSAGVVPFWLARQRLTSPKP